MKRLLLIICLAATCAGFLMADSFDEIRKNPRLTASNHTVYPDSALPALTPAPKGYEPFYITHYGRHGSRWHCSENDYAGPIALLEKYDRDGHLTPLGRKTLAQLRAIRTQAHKRWGDLTPTGARQHRDIARRMTRNFPEVFSGKGKKINAVSSMVQRCILSMTNETQQIQAFNPELDVTTDVSEKYQWLIAWGRTDSIGRYVKEGYKAAEDYSRNRVNPARFVAQLVDDPKYIADSVDSPKLMREIFSVAGILQNYDDEASLYSLFTPDELIGLWDVANIRHYISAGNAPQSRHLAPYGETHLLEEIICQADSAITKGYPAADMRFGHDGLFLPLVVLMELDSTAVSIDDLGKISQTWRDYRYFPMACNMQMIFYRSSSDPEILVKVLFNEHEATLPVTTDRAPYYRWNDVRDYYMNKLNTFKATHPNLMPYVSPDYRHGYIRFVPLDLPE